MPTVYDRRCRVAPAQHCLARASGGVHLIAASRASGAVLPGQSLCSHTAPAPRIDTFLQCPTVDEQNPAQVSRVVVGTRMADTSETKSATPPDRRANPGPKPDPVPPEEMRSQGHVVTEPKEEPPTPPNTPTGYTSPCRRPGENLQLGLQLVPVQLVYRTIPSWSPLQLVPVDPHCNWSQLISIATGPSWPLCIWSQLVHTGTGSSSCCNWHRLCNRDSEPWPAGTTADSFTEAPRAVPARREPPPAVADSTADQPVRHGRAWSSAGKPHACHICRRRYCSVEWLRRHVVTHERGKPLKCDRCGRSYMMRPALAKHKANVHDM
ncbi:uncharacterized protein [Dermacentor albipictus]|uniref:uncharacterized protein isoform X1 n=1 Tax=Dermacentor albipictus TaxID=60249 RepID=UPI0031FBA584